VIFAAPLDTPEGPVAMPEGSWLCVEMGRESGCVAWSAKAGLKWCVWSLWAGVDRHGFIWVESLSRLCCACLKQVSEEVWLRD
jgi:hypothetical protein